MKAVTEQVRAMMEESKANVSEIPALRAKCEELTGQLAELTEYTKRMSAPVTSSTGATPEVVRAFGDYCKRGIAGAQENDGASGGYLVVPELANQIIEKLSDVDVFRQYANVITVGSNALEVPLCTGDPVVSWVGETETRADDKSDIFGLANIGVNEEQINFPVSRRLLEDGMVVNFESYMTSKMADALGKAEGAAFVVGTGFKQPEGLFTCDKIPTVTSATSGTIKADDFIDLWADCPAAVDATGAYYVSKPIMAAMRKFKDSQGQYLWQAPIAEGAPATFNGFPVRVLASAPSTVAAGNKVAGFGALDKTYVVADRNEMLLLRDEYTSKKKGLVEFTIRRRVGGGVAMPDNFRLLQVHS